MTQPNQLRISRRKVLAGLGAVGLASAGAGLGTTAYFSDREDFEDNTLTAGELDLKVDYQHRWFNELTQGQNMYEPATWVAGGAYPDSGINGGTADDGVQDPLLSRDALAQESYGVDFANLSVGNQTVVEESYRAQFADVPDDAGPGVFSVSDVKPGDKGMMCVSLHLFDNPAYLWMWAGNYLNSENSVNEPESKDPDEDQTQEYSPSEFDTYVSDNGGVDNFGELGDEMLVSLVYGPECSVVDDTTSVVAIDGRQTTFGNLMDNFGDYAVTFNEALNGAYFDMAEPANFGLGDVGVYPLSAANSSTALDAGGDVVPCFVNSTTYYVYIIWSLPVDHANEVQSDSLSFDFGFYAEQCRHNDGTGDINNSTNAAPTTPEVLD